MGDKLEVDLLVWDLSIPLIMGLRSMLGKDVEFAQKHNIIYSGIKA